MGDLRYSNNSTKEKINFLVENDLDLLFISDSDDEQWFMVENFEPPTSGSVSSVPFLQFKGIDISNFIEENTFNILSVNHFLDRLTAFLQKEKQILMKISENHKWRFFTK